MAHEADCAREFITSCCARIGAFCGTNEPHIFIRQTASKMATAAPSDVFPERYAEHVAYALNMVATNQFTSSPAAVASVYLATRFEYYFRILSGKLNPDGTWLSPSAQHAARAVLNDPRIGGKRVSRVGLAYKIMKLDRSLALAQHCTRIDDALYPTPTKVVGGRTVADLGERIEFGRNAAGHGHWGDISAEAVFYGLMTALVFYSLA